MKEYEHKGVIIRIHDSETFEPVSRRKRLEEATIKLMKEVIKIESISTSGESTLGND